MSAGVLVSVEEYLRTSYRPDCDYVDGKAVERNSGGRKHSRAQREIQVYLLDRYPELRERIYPEQRVQVRAGRFRIPDICVTAKDAPKEEVVVTAPALCIEILSPDDSMARIMERIEDYFAMGVPTCWIVDPVNRRGWTATPGFMEDATGGALRAAGIEMPLYAVLEDA